MRTTRDAKHRYEVGIYDSLQDLLRGAEIGYAATGKDDTNFFQGSWNEGKTPVLAKGYMRTIDDLREAIRSPWMHGVETVRRMVTALEKIKLPEPRSVRRTPRYNSDGGDEVDHDRLRSGVDFWRRSSVLRSQDQAGPRLITVLADVTTSSNVDADKILWRGAAALAMTNVLEKRGYRVELWSYQNCAYAFHDGYGVYTAVRLKPMGKPLNLNALATGVAGWFYRYFMFLAYHNHQPNVPQGCLGSPRHGLDRWMIDYVTKEQNPIVMKSVWSLEDAVDQASKWLRKIIAGDKIEVVKTTPDWSYA
jgi:hypothetical protein